MSGLLIFCSSGKIMRGPSASHAKHCGSIHSSVSCMFMIQGLLKEHEAGRADAEFAILVKLYANQRTSLETWYAEQRRK